MLYLVRNLNDCFWNCFVHVDGWVLGEGIHLMWTLMMIVLCPMGMEGIIPSGVVTCATFIALAPLLSEMVAPQVEIATVCIAVLEYHVRHLLDRVCIILLAVLQAVNGKMKMLPLHVSINYKYETWLTLTFIDHIHWKLKDWYVKAKPIWKFNYN